MTNIKLALLAITSILTVQSCAHSVERRIDAKLAHEAVNSREDLRTEAGKLIQMAPGLTADQRIRLTNLRKATQSKLDEIQTQSLKLRSLLIKDLITTRLR